MKMVVVVIQTFWRIKSSKKLILGRLIVFLIKYKGHMSEYSIVMMVRVCIWGQGYWQSLLHLPVLRGTQGSLVETKC